MTLFGVGAPFWGVVVGSAALLILRLGAGRSQVPAVAAQGAPVRASGGTEARLADDVVNTAGLCRQSMMRMWSPDQWPRKQFWHALDSLNCHARSLALAIASLAAGLVDSIVGGGGLILVPTLLGAFPRAPVATLFGTNKAAAICGTSWAASRYARRVQITWLVIGPSAAAAAVGSALGAWTLTRVPGQPLRKVLPLLLFAVLIYTVRKKDLGRHHLPKFCGRAEVLVAVAALVGFYDGFFGPGTGSLLMFAFVRILGYDFLQASAAAKLLNSATNAAALALFVSTGNVWWQLALVMGVANVLGSVIGTGLALRHGVAFVRSAFLVVVCALILKTSVDAFAGCAP